MKICICGNTFTEQLGLQLEHFLSGYEIVFGDPQNFMDELTNPPEEFRTADFIVLALDWKKICPEISLYTFGDQYVQFIDIFKTQCTRIEQAIKRLRSLFNAKFFIFSPVSDCTYSTGFITRLLDNSQIFLFYECQNLFNQLCKSTSDTYPLDIDAISSRIGKDNAFYADTFSDLFVTSIARELFCSIVQFQKYPLKCLVLDLDNTLWGGIIGETGASSIQLGDTNPGFAYKRFQIEILKLYKQGIFLAVCSKNNTCDALEVIESHPHMVIKPKMISSFRINWNPKPENLVSIAEELRIGLDSMMFADDNPAEREMIRHTLPEVEILDLPDNPMQYAEALRKVSRFWPIQLTSDDLKKRTFFSLDQLRKHSVSLSDDMETFLHKSEIRVKIKKADTHSLPRIAQLFNKTNQFNLTTKRYSQSMLEKIISLDGTTLFFMEMSDKFGEYGIVASALLIDNRIDSFLLSCRAFGKHAEKAFLSYVLHYIKEAGFEKAQAEYVPTLKNSMVKNFYQSAGFVQTESFESTVSWSFDFKDDVIPVPPWINIIG